MLTRLVPNLKKTGADEWTGPCPFCGGNDRFVVNLKNGGTGGLYWCRRCEAQGDSITFLRQTQGFSYRQACDELGVALSEYQPTPGSHFKDRIKRKKRRHFKPTVFPSEDWMEMAELMVRYGQANDEDTMLAQYAVQRGLSLATLRASRVGYNPTDLHDDPTRWGFTEEDIESWPTQYLHIYPGMVIPWVVSGRIVRVNIRIMDPFAEKRYRHIKGGRSGLFTAGEFDPRRDTIVCEGEIDAMSIYETGIDVNAVATGSAQGSRDQKSVATLASSPRLFVALDTDKAGDDGWKFWEETFKDARRIKPVGGDINDMLINNTLKDWINEQR